MNHVNRHFFPDCGNSTIHVQPRASTDRAVLGEIFAAADICLDGRRPWDIRVHDDRFYARVLSAATLGLGESYMEGWWDCEALDELFFRAIRTRLPERVRPNLRAAISIATAIGLNLQNKPRAHRVAQHYDLGNEFFQAMLDPAM